MSGRRISRRTFIKGTAAVAGTTLAATTISFPLLASEPNQPATEVAEPKKKTAADKVILGKTGLTPSRLGFGTGFNNGQDMRILGTDGAVDLIKYAMDQGITYLDTAKNYNTHSVVRDAIKDVDREKLFIQTKMIRLERGSTTTETVESYLKELNTDYVDSLLIHCVMESNWDQQRKQAMDELEELKEKGKIKSHGISTHSLAATTLAAQSDWVDVNLVRINPQGYSCDTAQTSRFVSDRDPKDIKPVMEQIKIMHENKHGVIAMKLIGGGYITTPEARAESIRFVMTSGFVHAAVIGLKSRAEVDEAIKNMNAALADTENMNTAPADTEAA